LRTALATPANALGDLRADTLHDRPLAFRTLLPELEIAFDQLVRVARSRVPLLFLGETGTGKELLAQASHELSTRGGAFVALNCAALPESLREAQLFGHVRGAFSGATRDELGYVRAADGGSLFLDEIGDLASASQTALLRVLQENEVVPVGTTRPIRVDVRFLSATHAALRARAESGSFRSDLFARLAGFTFRAPALRDRIEDLGLMIGALLPELEHAAGGPLRLHPDAARLLLSYAWPRNVRELRQCLVAAAVLATARVIEVNHLPAVVAQVDADRTLDSAQQEQLHSQLIALFVEHRGNVTHVARAMGKARVQVQRWMKRFAIDPGKFR
jgi:DNA-binding NtrC family response regulator